MSDNKNPPSTKFKISNELKTMMSQANIQEPKMEDHLKERAGSQIKDYLRIVNMRLSKEDFGEENDNSMKDQILCLLQTIAHVHDEHD